MKHYEPNPLLDTVLPLAVIGAVIAVVVALSAPSIRQQMDKVAGIRSKVDQIRETQQSVSLEFARAEQEEKLASQRVTSNCVWVDGNGFNQRVVAGVKLIDPKTRYPIADRDVCDLSGNTAETDAEGVVIPSTLARTRKAVPKQYHRSPWFKRSQEESAL